MRHCEKRRSWVCSSVMEVVSDEMLACTVEMQEEKKVVAKEAEPTGWPRRRKPVVSSTGIGGADLSVGCGRVENSAMVVEIDVARTGFIVWRRGNVEDPLQEVSIRVFEGLMKQPREEPSVLRVVQRKGKSGR
jgi:hypothetical protein